MILHQVDCEYASAISRIVKANKDLVKQIEEQTRKWEIEKHDVEGIIRAAVPEEPSTQLETAVKYVLARIQIDKKTEEIEKTKKLME